MASVPRLVDKRQLTHATSIDYTLRSIVRLVGPAVSGTLYAVSHAIPFLADAASYIGSILSLRWMTTRFQEDRARTSRHLGREIVEGVAWMWRQPVLRFQALAGCVLSFAFFPNTLLVTVLAQRQHASDAAIGLIFTLAAVGTLIGSPLAPVVQRRLSFGQVIAGMFWVLALLWPLYALASSVFALGLITAAIYLVECIGSIVNIGYRLALTPDHYQGRVNSLHRLVGFGVGQPLGAIVSGLLLDRFDLRVAILSCAVALAMMALVTSLYRPVRLATRLV
jgi:predicted MFS family arabinose efflux permease